MGRSAVGELCWLIVNPEPADSGVSGFSDTPSVPMTTEEANGISGCSIQAVGAADIVLAAAESSCRSTN